MNKILSNYTLFDGNASEYDWVVESGTVLNTAQQELVLTLTETNGGTKLSSTRYVHYGTIDATIKAGKWDGVIIAFIMMADDKDEIDWE
jgi:beta-glucanase (GH16 family)